MSTIRPTSRARSASILVGLAVVASAALLPTAEGAGTTPGHHLEFRLFGPTHQNVVAAGAIEVRGRCPAEACTVVASATSANPSIQTETARTHIPAGSAETISLSLSRRQKGKLKAALEAGHRPIFTVKAVARGKAGTRVPLALKVKPTKP